jgi:outer membrane protein TolC
LGSTGRNLNELDTTGTIQGTVTITLFDRDRGGELAQKESRLQRIEHQLADLRVGLEQELREALMDLDSAEAQVTVAQKGQGLAERELALARTRFETGVANNIEVTNAQESIARAQENSILALARYADARAALTRARGGAHRSMTP